MIFLPQHLSANEVGLLLQAVQTAAATEHFTFSSEFIFTDMDCRRFDIYHRSS